MVHTRIVDVIMLLTLHRQSFWYVQFVVQDHCNILLTPKWPATTLEINKMSLNLRVLRGTGYVA